MLKKFLIGTFFALAFLVAASQASADCSITTTLRVGSTGAEVQCLQTKVGATADGSFGPLTKASVMAFQANHSLSADGVVGPLTRAVLMGLPTGNLLAGCTSTAGYSSTTGLPCSGSSSLPAGCAVGALYSSTTGLSCTVATNLPAGCTSTAGYSSTTGAKCDGGVSPIISTSGEGSATVTFDSLPINSTAVYRGEDKAVMGIKVKATGSDMKVTRLWLDIASRIWLSADTVTLLDGSTVLATLPLTASTVTEVTSGSAWRLEFNSLNVVVPVNTTKVLTVKVNRPSATVADADVVVAITSSLRAIDGAGITDTYAFTTLGTRTWDFIASAVATGTMTAALGTNSPAEGSISGLSATSGVTTDVKLMDFALKATNGNVNVTALSGTIATTGTCTIAQCISSIELRDGTTVLDSVAVVAANSTFAFDEQSIDVAQDATKTLSVWAKVNHVASSYVVAGDSIKATVSSITATTGTSFTAISDSFSVVGNKQYLFQYAPTITLGAVSAVQVDESITASTNKGANYSLAFAVTAPAGSDIYVDFPSTATVIAYDATTAGVSKTNDTYGAALVVTTSVSGATSKGTVATTFDKVAAGTSRTFTITGYVAKPATAVAGYVGMKLTGILWNANDSFAGATDTVQTWGLADFKTPSIYTSRQ